MFTAAYIRYLSAFLCESQEKNTMLNTRSWEFFEVKDVKIPSSLVRSTRMLKWMNLSGYLSLRHVEESPVVSIELPADLEPNYFFLFFLFQSLSRIPFISNYISFRVRPRDSGNFFFKSCNSLRFQSNCTSYFVTDGYANTRYTDWLLITRGRYHLGPP